MIVTKMFPSTERGKRVGFYNRDMARRWVQVGALSQRHGRLGFTLIALGEALILVRLRPISDFYFPIVWLGYVLFLDAATVAQIGYSLFTGRRRLWLALFPLSAAFWWVFEAFNLVVHNWIYVGGNSYGSAATAVIASVDFSTVLPAVWSSALFVLALGSSFDTLHAVDKRVPRWALVTMLSSGLVCLVLPALFPRYAFGLVWGCVFLLLDPLNCRLGRPSMIAAVWNRRFWLPLSFALGALMCGFFWEGWNYWSMPKWKYEIPYVGFWHIFEMPLLGWAGYLPFGLELFAMTNFVLPWLNLRPLTLTTAPEPDDAARAGSIAS